MNWFQRLAGTMPLTDALRIFQFQSPTEVSVASLKKRYRELALLHHPDRNRDPSAQNKMVQINLAKESLDKFLLTGQEDIPGSEYQNRNRQEEGIPAWQTDRRSSYNGVGPDRRHVNFCKKEIYEYSIQQGGVSEYTFWAFDGNFFRGVFSAYSNEQSLGFGGEVIEFWNSKGANSYPTVAVFVSTGSSVFKMIRAYGKDVSKQTIIFRSESGNPGNDRNTVNEIKQKLSEMR